LKCNFSKIYDHVTDYCPDVFAISETWVKKNETEEIKIKNYNFFHVSRKSDKRGGGVGVYVNSNISAKIPKIDLTSDFEPCFEYIILEIAHKRKNVLIICLYRPPSNSIKTFFVSIDHVLAAIAKKYSNFKIFFLGDFNVDINTNSLAGDLLDCFNQYGFVQTILDPTRETQNSCSTIDLVFTNITGNFSSGVIPTFISDHYVTYINVNKSKISNNHCFVKCRNLSKVNWESVECFINDKISNSTNFSHNDFTDLENILVCSLDKYAPQRLIRCTKPFAPWVQNDTVKVSMRDRDKLKRKYLKDRSEINRAYYRQAVKETDKIIKQERLEYLSNVFHLNDTKKLWQTINSLLVNNKNSTNPNPDLFINYICTVAKRLLNSCPVKTDKIFTFIMCLPPSTGSSFNFHSEDPKKVKQVILKLKNNKIDKKGISTNLLKCCASVINTELAASINKSITNNRYPEALKHSFIVPVCKSDKSCGLDNFRPIAIQPTLSKVFERIIHSQIQFYLDSNKLLSQTQFGFRPEKSVNMLLHNLHDIVRKNLNQGKLSVVIMLDFSKAFDTIDHFILIRKLYKLGFSTDALFFILSYLRERSIQIAGNEKSSPQKILSGIPQGSILGPLLFNIYVNDLGTIFDEGDTVFQFADDTQIVLSFSKSNSFDQIIAKVENTIETANEWAGINNLVLNKKKTQVLPIFNRNSTFSKMPFFTNPQYSFVSQAKNLGVYFNFGLNWNTHFIELNKWFRKAYHVLRNFTSRFTSKHHFNLRKRIVNCIIFSKLSFCSSLFFIHSDHCKKIWNQIIRRLANLITGHFCHTTDALKCGYRDLSDTINRCLITIKDKLNPTVTAAYNCHNLRKTRPKLPICLHNTTTHYLNKLFY